MKPGAIPDTAEFIRLWELASKYRTAAQWPPKEVERATAILAPRPLTLGLLFSGDYERFDVPQSRAEIEAEFSWAQKVRTEPYEKGLADLRAGMEDTSALRWLRKHSELQEIEAFALKNYGQPIAWFKTIACVALAMTWFQLARKAPGRYMRPKKDTIRKAITALETLAECAQEGLGIWPVTFDPKSNRFTPSLQETLEELRIRLSTEKQAYSGGYPKQRVAMRTFAEELAREFGKPSETLMALFGEMIGYPTNAVRKLMRELRANRSNARPPDVS